MQSTQKPISVKFFAMDFAISVKFLISEVNPGEGWWVALVRGGSVAMGSVVVGGSPAVGGSVAVKKKIETTVGETVQ